MIRRSNSVASAEGLSDSSVRTQNSEKVDKVQHPDSTKVLSAQESPVKVNGNEPSSEAVATKVSLKKTKKGKVVATKLKSLKPVVTKLKIPKPIVPKLKIRLGPKVSESGKQLSKILSDLVDETNDATPENRRRDAETKSFDQILKEQHEIVDKNDESAVLANDAFERTCVARNTDIGSALNVLLTMEVEKEIIGSVLDEILCAAVELSERKAAAVEPEVEPEQPSASVDEAAEVESTDDKTEDLCSNVSDRKRTNRPNSPSSESQTHPDVRNQNDPAPACPGRITRSDERAENSTKLSSKICPGVNVIKLFFVVVDD